MSHIALCGAVYEEGSCEWLMYKPELVAHSRGNGARRYTNSLSQAEVSGPKTLLVKK